jgi:hypothetical protein
VKDRVIGREKFDRRILLAHLFGLHSHRVWIRAVVVVVLLGVVLNDEDTTTLHVFEQVRVAGIDVVARPLSADSKQDGVVAGQIGASVATE